MLISLKVNRVLLFFNLWVNPLFYEDAMPNHKGQYCPQPTGMVGDPIAMFLEHFQQRFFIKDVIGFGSVDSILRFSLV